MNKAEKALAACKEYDRLMTEIRKNTKTSAKPCLAT